MSDKIMKTLTINGVTYKIRDERVDNLSSNGSGGVSFETQQIDIAVSDWNELPDSEPYTYFANVTLSKPLDNAISIELINNDPIVFAKFGFAIGQVTAMDELEIYSIGNPDGNVTLTFETVSQTSSVNLINFTVNGTSYQAEEGMTWEEWCNSEYNISSSGSKIYVVNQYNYIVGYASGITETIYVSTDGTSYGRVLKTDLIQTLNYQCYREPHSGGN